LAAFLNRKLDVDTWLIFSTIVSLFLIVKMGRLGADIFVGYPILLLNTGILLLLGRLVIHKVHAILIGIVTFGSVMAAHFSPTPLTSIIAQVIGVSLFSVCYFSMLLTSGLTIPRWINLYASCAFYLAVYGLVAYIAQHTLHFSPLSDQRLKAIFNEPALFVYTTLPAIGYYINCWVTERRYGTEVLIFLVAYVLADSALGFVGLLMIGAFTFIKRLTIWHLLTGALVMALLLTGLFFASQNFRFRVTDTYFAISNMSLAHTNGSTFALLSNLYVAGNAMMDYPVLGVGIGGYRSIYINYIGDITEGEDIIAGSVGLNMDDANSLFIRVAAELGPIGLIGLIWFLVVCARVDGKPYRQIRNALLPYFLIRMGRYGAYFSLELYFFVGLYLLNYLDYRRSLAPPKPVEMPTDAHLSPA